MKEIYAQEVGPNVTSVTIKMASQARTTLKDEPVPLVPDLSKFVLNLIKTYQRYDKIYFIHPSWGNSKRGIVIMAVQWWNT